MREVKIGKHKLKIYDSIEELPIVRYHKFNKFVLIDAHIGSSIQEFDMHLEKASRYIKNGKMDLAGKELQNLRQNVFFIQNEFSPQLMSLAVLVYSIDGKEVGAPTDENLTAVTKLFESLSVKEFQSIYTEVKKKLETELQTYFPSLFDSSSVKEYYNKLRERVLLVLEDLGKEEKENREKIAQLAEEIVLYTDPLVFSGSQGIEVQQDRQFENTCLAISQNTGADPKKFSVLEYYNALFFLQEQGKKHKTRKK